MQRPITLPGWFNMRNAVFILSGLAVLGFAYLLISIKVTQNRQEKSQELSALFAGAQQSLASGNHDKAISLYREMEALSAAMLDWSFSAKNGLSRALVKAGRAEEARSKLGEAEMILKKNPEI
jgi:Flp pilus assembly protein TadD